MVSGLRTHGDGWRGRGVVMYGNKKEELKLTQKMSDQWKTVTSEKHFLFAFSVVDQYCWRPKTLNCGEFDELAHSWIISNGKCHVTLGLVHIRRFHVPNLIQILMSKILCSRLELIFGCMHSPKCFMVFCLYTDRRW